MTNKEILSNVIIDSFDLLNLSQFKYEDEDNEYYEKQKEIITNRLKNILIKPKKQNNIDTDDKKSINKYKLELKNHKINKEAFKVGLYNTRIKDKSIEENLLHPANFNYNEFQSLIKYLNLALSKDRNKNCNLIVFPEISIPLHMLTLLADFTRKNKIAVVCGVKHIVLKKNKDGKKVKSAYNYIATMIPFGSDDYTDTFLNLRLKKWYAPAEAKLIKKLKMNVPEDKDLKNNLFIWNNIYFAA
ncbi:MAG: hypothetical protein WCG95_07635, partial [bacterium]